MTKLTQDETADRLIALLDTGFEALKNGDPDGCILALQEATKVADSLPQRVICLPDLSKAPMQ